MLVRKFETANIMKIPFLSKETSVICLKVFEAGQHPQTSLCSLTRTESPILENESLCTNVLLLIVFGISLGWGEEQVSLEADWARMFKAAVISSCWPLAIWRA
jgi:hypothetical protein